MEEHELRCPYCGGPVELAPGLFVLMRNYTGTPPNPEPGDDNVYDCTACGWRGARRHIRWSASQVTFD